MKYFLIFNHFNLIVLLRGCKKTFFFSCDFLKEFYAAKSKPKKLPCAVPRPIKG